MIKYLNAIKDVKGAIWALLGAFQKHVFLMPCTIEIIQIKTQISFDKLIFLLEMPMLKLMPALSTI